LVDYFYKRIFGEKGEKGENGGWFFLISQLPKLLTSGFLSVPVRVGPWQMVFLQEKGRD
jgi:hypothetical protein